MNNLFQVLLGVIKAKITPIITKIKLWTNINYIWNRVILKIRQGISKIFNIRPKDKDDYYGIGRWLISKKLAFAIVIAIGIVSIYYIFYMNTPAILKADDTGIKTYKYNSVPLRFTDGRVRITAKSGYLAYEGEVSGGTANGKGQLYRKDGTLLYTGGFEKSKFQGEGRMYYPSEQLQYNGGFVDNLFSGNGKLYRENGSLEYEGSFLSGMKDGVGNYFDSAGNVVFTGNFAKDQLLYTDFLGKSTEEVSEIYTGKRVIYTNDSNFVVSMPDIGAIYYGKNGNENLEGNINVEGVYVLSESFAYSGETYQNIYEVQEILGDAVYEGNAYITMPEAVAIHVLNEKGNEFYGDVKGIWNENLADVIEVEKYDAEYTFYLYTYVKDNLRYTFFAKDRTGIFSMYSIEQE